MFACVHSGASRCLRELSGSRVFNRERIGVAWFIRVAWVHLVRVGVAGFITVGCRRVHLGSYGFTRARLGFARFILVRLGSLGCAYVSQVSFLFACVHSGARSGRRVHSGSLGFIQSE